MPATLFSRQGDCEVEHGHGRYGLECAAIAAGTDGRWSVRYEHIVMNTERSGQRLLKCSD